MPQVEILKPSKGETVPLIPHLGVIPHMKNNLGILYLLSARERVRQNRNAHEVGVKMSDKCVWVQYCTCPLEDFPRRIPPPGARA